MNQTAHKKNLISNQNPYSHTKHGGLYKQVYQMIDSYIQYQNLDLFQKEQGYMLDYYYRYRNYPSNVVFNQQKKYLAITMSIFKRRLRYAQPNSTIQLNLEKGVNSDSAIFFTKMAVEMIAKEIRSRNDPFSVKVRFVGGCGLQFCAYLDMFIYRQDRRPFVKQGKIPKVLAGILQGLSGLGISWQNLGEDRLNYGALTCDFCYENTRIVQQNRQQFQAIHHILQIAAYLLNQRFVSHIQCMRYPILDQSNLYYRFKLAPGVCFRVIQRKKSTGKFEIYNQQPICYWPLENDD